jgi:hypothetical protein
MVDRLGMLCLHLHATMLSKVQVVWSILLMLLTLISRAAMHPEKSLDQFVLWTLISPTFHVTMYPVYLLYWKHSDRSQLFPFSLFSGQWRVSRPMWYPASARLKPSDCEALCEQCMAFTAKSKFIMGSKSLLAPLIELY